MISAKDATFDTIEDALDDAFAVVTIGVPKTNAAQSMTLAEHVARVHGVTVSDILGPCRRAKFVKARRDAWRMARSMGWSFPEIGEAFNRHHTTIMAGMRE